MGKFGSMPRTTERTKSNDMYLTVRVPRDLGDAINRIADMNDRTQAAEIRVALRKHYEFWQHQLESDSPTR